MKIEGLTNPSNEKNFNLTEDVVSGKRNSLTPSSISIIMILKFYLKASTKV